MKMYKSSYFKPIKIINVISFTETKVTLLRSEKLYFDKSAIHHDRVVTIDRHGSQSIYHETMQEAKNFVLMQLSDKITKMELDLIKYKSFVPEFQ